MATREELEAKAKELNVDFNSDTPDEEIKSMISIIEDKNKNNKDPEYLEAEMKKAIDARDKAKKEKRFFKSKMDELEKQKEELEKQVKDTPDKNKLEELNVELKDLKEFKESVEKEKRKKEEEQLDEVGKLQARIKRKEEEHKELIDKAKQDTTSTFETKLNEALGTIKTQSKAIESLRGSRLEADIMKAANKCGAIEPSHVFKMLKNDFSYDDEENKFFFYTRDKKGDIKDEIEIKDYIKDFLDKEENDYLVKADFKGSSFNTLKNQDRSKNKKTDFGDYNPKDPKLLLEAEKEGISIEGLIRSKMKRDAKMKKVRENKK